MRVPCAFVTPGQYNMLVLGLHEKYDLIPQKQGFLFIGSGALCDEVRKKHKRAVTFDTNKDSFNPLKGMTEKQAEEFAELVYGKEGKDTLTARNGKRALKELVFEGERLDKIVGEGDAGKEAQAAINDVLFYPVMRRVLCNHTNFSFKAGRSIIMEIDNELSEKCSRLLVALLVSQFKGPVIISDFGRLVTDAYKPLLREGRLSVGVNTLAELDKEMRQTVLMMEERIGYRCTFDDAEVLAQYAGLIPRTNEYNAFVGEMVG